MVYKRILTVVDETRSSVIVARYALRAAAADKAKLFLFGAVCGQSDKEAIRRVEHHRERLFSECVDQGLEVETIMETGDRPARLRQVISREAIELVFHPLYRPRTGHGLLNRSTADHLVSSLPCSLALVRVVHMGKPHPRRILVPVSYDIPAYDRLAPFLASVALEFNAKITLFHLRTPAIALFAKTHDYGEDKECVLSPDMERLLDYLSKKGVAVTGRTRDYRIGRGITIEAAAKRDDLIIMGARQRGVLKSLVHGDPVGEVLQETPCNLMILAFRG